MVRTLFLKWGVVLPGVVLCSALSGAEEPVEVVQKAAAEWVRTRAETVRLESEWSSQQQLLESMVQGIAERAQSIETKRDYLLAKTAKDREEQASLEAGNQASAAGLQAGEVRMKELSARVIALRGSLPPRLSQALELPYRSLANPELTLSDRAQLVLTVLNRCVQFNRSITCEEEILHLAEGENGRQLEVIYWGLSHGYALDRSAGQAWYGSPGPAGWRWAPLSDAAKPVAELIAIQRGKAEPDFVLVPAALKLSAGEPAKK